jgi:hypothetical protein
VVNIFQIKDLLLTVCQWQIIQIIQLKQVIYNCSLTIGKYFYYEKESAETRKKVNRTGLCETVFDCLSEKQSHKIRRHGLSGYS